MTVELESPLTALTGVALFLVIHALLHLLFSDYPAYEFHSILSDALIFGGAVCGAAYIALRARGRRPPTP